MLQMKDMHLAFIRKSLQNRQQFMVLLSNLLGSSTLPCTDIAIKTSPEALAFVPTAWVISSSLNAASRKVSLIHVATPTALAVATIKITIKEKEPWKSSTPTTLVSSTICEVMVYGGRTELILMRRGRII